MFGYFVGEQDVQVHSLLHDMMVQPEQNRTFKIPSQYKTSINMTLYDEYDVIRHNKNIN